MTLSAFPNTWSHCSCIAEPELNVQFTVKDKKSVNAALLENACVNAKAKAGILAKLPV